MLPARLPSQIAILPLSDQAVLFPGLLLRLRVPAQTSAKFLSRVLQSDQNTWVSLVLGCVPVLPGAGTSQLPGTDIDSTGEGSTEGTNSANPATSGKPTPSAGHGYGCAARIKSISRIDRTAYILVVEGSARIFLR
jgi:Lon protease-like protein